MILEPAEPSPVVCAECGVAVPRRNGRQLYCTDSCRARAKGRRHARSRRARGVRSPSEAPKPAVQRACPVCGSDFSTARADQVHCSKRCGQVAKDDAKRSPCAGGCGRLCWDGPTAAPAGERMCRPCRKARRGGGDR